MKTSLSTMLLAALCGCAGTAAAAPASVMVSDCWIRLLPGNLPSGGYFSVMNMGAQPIDLTGVRTDAYGKAMLHQTQSNGSTSNMVMVDKVTVPAHGTLAFTPGGFHLMLEQPRTPLKVGMPIPFTFVFSDGEQVNAECETKSAAAMSH
ncbi:copper transporter [Paraburkholderia steynii]|uniref:Copper transporter n=1 Tax=Paraburkholderia steynii TaxID=1245441 RepID=A0A4R0X6Q5_9BURK|nr:copper transporter [Paraburkholderia steynii]